MRKNIWNSLVVVLLFSVIILSFTYKLGLIYHQNNLTKGDSTYYYYFAGTVLQVAKADGISRALFIATSLPDQNTILHYLAVAILSPIIPMSTSIGTILNSFWYLLMAASLCLFFWDKTQSVMLSSLLPIPLLIAGLPLIDVYQGLTDLHVNLLGYTLGTSIMCFVLISDCLRRTWPTLLAGLLLGILLLGRIHSVALVGIAIAPLIFGGLFFTSKVERNKTLWGMVMLGAVSLLVSGWWFIPHLSTFLLPFQWYGVPRGSMGVDTMYSTAWSWLDVVSGFFLFNIAYRPLALVLSWIGGAQVALSRNFLSLIKRINWIYIWMGIAPLLVLILMRTGYQYYGWPALFGFYLSVIFPFRDAENEVRPLKNPVFQGVLLVAIACAIIGFAFRMFSSYTTTYTNKQSALQAVDSILNDVNLANDTGTDITAGLAYYGDLNLGTLANVFIFDRGCPVVIPTILPDAGVPTSTNCQRILLPEDVTQNPSEWDRDVVGEKKVSVELAFDDITSQADYVVILSPESWETAPPIYPKYWPEWVELSQRLYLSETFHPITSSLTITPLEKIIVLRRNPTGE